MPDRRDLCRGHKSLWPLIEYALSEGWQVVHTAGDHLKFTKAGLPPLFTGSTATDCRAGQQAVFTESDHSNGGAEHG